MCRTNGTLAYVGMSAYIPEDQPNMIFPDKLIRVRTGVNLDAGFFWHLTQTEPIRSQIELAARTAVGNYAIGGTDIRNFEFPLPPLEVQRHLVKHITSERKRIANERKAAEQRAAQTKIEVEEMILGHRPVPRR